MYGWSHHYATGVNHICSDYLHDLAKTIQRVNHDLSHQKAALAYCVLRLCTIPSVHLALIYSVHKHVAGLARSRSTILGAVDKTGPALFVVEPSGVSYV